MSGNHKSKLKVLHEQQGGKCYYCGIQTTLRTGKRGSVKSDTATKEHLHRKCDGGLHDMDNLVMACRGCNTGRNEHPPELWRSNAFRSRVAVYRSIRKKYKSKRYHKTFGARFIRSVFNYFEKIDGNITKNILTTVK